MSDLSPLERLVAESACRSLLEHYSSVVDWMDWETMKKLFWSDARFDFGMWAGNFDEFLPWVKQLEEGYARRLHLLCIQGITIEGGIGRAGVGLTILQRLTDQTGESKDEIMFGRYFFRFECRDLEWRISSLSFLMHGVQRFQASDQGGAPLFADGLTPAHPMFSCI